MSKTQEKSKCCFSNVKVEGKTTKYYVCLKCGEACDVVLIDINGSDFNKEKE